MLPDRTDVLIVGAGPTGLALAITLQNAGIECVVVEQRESPQTTSRAAVIHAHTLEVLERIGVADELAARGLKRHLFKIRDRDHVLFELDFRPLPSRHNYLLMIPQEVTEEILRDRFAALGGSIRFDHQVIAVSKNREQGQAEIAHRGSKTTVTARYLVGADGMHSVVRQAAGISFEGETYEQSFMLADVRIDWALGNEEVNLFFSPDGLVVVAPLPDGFHRVVATMDAAPEKPEISDIQSVLDQRGPQEGDAKVADIKWRSRFRVHHRLAGTYANGPLIVVGDAAHVHSPAGGQGMNCGLVDACVLGELIADIIAGRRPENDIRLYEKLRRPAAQEVLNLAARMTGVATVKSPLFRLSRNGVLRIANYISPLKRVLCDRFSGIARRPLAKL